MESSRRRLALRKLLGLCDDLHRIRNRLADPGLGTGAERQLRRQSKRKDAQLARELAGYRFRGPLGELVRGLALGPAHFQVLAVLLQRRMRSEDPALSGRALLSSVYDSAFGVLSGLDLLAESSPLRRAGLVLVEDEEEEPRDLLETRFQVSEEALETFLAELSLQVPEDLRRASSPLYGSPRELLIDLRILHNLYRARSERVFQQGRWDRVHSGPFTPGAFLSRRIETFWSKIRQKLKASPDAESFAVCMLMRDHDLGERELVVVVHLLFRELYEGSAHAEVSELVRLVSSSEEQLIRNRRLFLPEAPLRKGGILHVEPMLEGRELTGEAHLEDWVVNALFGSSAKDLPIRADERLDWHRYLEDLGGSDRFFDDLEKS
jgi:hypothetical protein